ncbi:MAG: hypothetical protein AAF593_01290 [Planctomycetota bacterium]
MRDRRYRVVVTQDDIYDGQRKPVTYRVYHEPDNRMVLSHHLTLNHAVNAVWTMYRMAWDDAEGVPRADNKDLSREQIVGGRFLQRVGGKEKLEADLRRIGVCEDEPVPNRLGLLRLRIFIPATVALLATVALTAYHLGRSVPTTVSIPPVAVPARELPDLESEMNRGFISLPFSRVPPLIDAREPWAYAVTPGDSVTRYSLTGHSPPTVIYDGSSAIGRLTLSPDGTTLGVLDKPGVFRRVATNRPDLPAPELSLPGALGALLLDASHVAWQDDDGRWTVTNADTQEHTPLPDVTRVVPAVSINGLAAMVYEHGPRRLLEVRDLIDGYTYATLSLKALQTPVSIDATKDKRIIAVGLSNGTLIRVARTNQGETIRSASFNNDNGRMNVRVDDKMRRILVTTNDLRMVEPMSLTTMAATRRGRMPESLVTGIHWCDWPYRFGLLSQSGITLWKP